MEQILQNEPTYDRLSVFGVGEPDAHRLVDKKYVRLVVPTVWVRLGLIRARHPART